MYRKKTYQGLSNPLLHSFSFSCGSRGATGDVAVMWRHIGVLGGVVGPYTRRHCAAALMVVAVHVCSLSNCNLMLVKVEKK
jgi:hypothetical protein